MSLDRSSIGSILGGTVGLFFGVPGIGSLIGGAIGRASDKQKTERVSVPALDDLTVQTSTYGAPIATTYGTITVLGNVIWLENGKIAKVSRTSGGGGGKKGGGKPKVTSWYYVATWAVALGKGPVLGGIRRIWLGTTLFYDAGSDDDETIAASNQASKLFTFYPGTDTQNPDPRMQATLGVDNTPAYRGIAYIVFEDVDLGPYQNNLMSAAAKVEIIRSGVAEDYVVTKHSMPANIGNQEGAWNGKVFCFLDWTSAKSLVSSDGKTWTEHSFPILPGWVKIASNGEIFVAVTGTPNQEVITSYDGKHWVVRPLGTNSGLVDVVWTGTFFYAVTSQSIDPYYASYDGEVWLPVSESQDSTSLISYPLLWSGQRIIVHLPGGDTPSMAHSETGLSGSWTIVPLPGCQALYSGAAKNGRVIFPAQNVGVGRGVYVSDDHGFTWTFYLTTGLASLVETGIVANENVFFVYDGAYIYWSEDGIAWSSKNVATGYEAGQGPDREPVFNGAVWVTMATEGSASLRVRPRTIASSTVSLGEIVEDQCLRSGVLESTDIITTSLTDAVRGYRIGSQGTMRSALEPLQAAFPFDVRQHGYKIEFLRRGAVGSVMTIPYDDLGARAAGSEPGARITQKIKNDAALPKRLSIQYLDPLREYDVGSQYAERPSSTAVNEEKFDLPMVLSATEAAGKCETLLYLAWLERTEVRFTLPEMVYAALEPGDVVTVESPDGDLILHLTSINTTANGVMEIVGNPYRQELFTPGALGADSLSNGETHIYAIKSPVFRLLDLPHIETIQDVPGFVVAAAGTNPIWPGGTLLRARDRGVDGYTAVMGLSAPGPVMAFANNALSYTVDSRVVDTASVLYVTLQTPSTLSSVSRTAMLNGQNLFAYGSHARWEIISVANCVQDSETDYVLTDFLRGRFGTEWAIPRHMEGDQLILLDTAELSFLQLTLDAIGVPWLYKAVTDGLSADATPARSYTYRGVAFKPISPVLLNGYRNPGTGDWDLTWVRRSRSHVRWITSVSYPLGEVSEEYRIEFYTDLGYGTKVREITITSPAVTYTSAQQGTDFGGDQTTLYVKIFQISAAVGDGTPLTTSITRA